MGIAVKVGGWGTLAVLATMSLAFAQSPSDDSLRAPLDVAGYAVEGRVLLKAEDVTRIVSPFIGQQKTLADIDRARDALQQAYISFGHCSVRVSLSRFERQYGVVVFRLDEIPAGELRDCKPAVALSDQPTARVETGRAKDKPAPAAELVPLPPTALKFEIRRYLAQGNTLLTDEELEKVLAPFTGKDKDFGDVQRALEALQVAYLASGYGGVEIRLPEQELERGEVRFTVIEATIRRIIVEGNRHFSYGNVRRSVPSLRVDQTPNSRDIAQTIRLANENPAKQSTVLLRGADREDQLDATVRVADIDPQRWSVTLDNTGNENTGSYRLGFAYQHANVRDRDHVLTTQFLTSPDNINNVKVFGLGYRIPLYLDGDSVDFIGGYSDVDSGVVENLFVVTGKGSVYAVRYNQGLAKWGDLDQKLIYGFDWREYRNNVIPIGGVLTLVPDITVHPVSLTYAASLRQEQREISFFLSYSYNLAGGNDGGDDDFKKARFEVGTARYRLFRAGGTFTTPLPFFGDWQFRARLDSQYTEDALVTGEQFAIGGADNVRGFTERYVSNDKGIRTNWEIYTPDMAKLLRFDNGRVRFLTFYDTGKTGRNYPIPGEFDSASLDSAGFGVRLSYKTSLTARADIAYVFHDGSQPPDSPTPDGRRHVTKGHFSVSWVW